MHFRGAPCQKSQPQGGEAPKGAQRGSPWETLPRALDRNRGIWLGTAQPMRQKAIQGLLSRFRWSPTTSIFDLFWADLNQASTKHTGTYVHQQAWLQSRSPQPVQACLHPACLHPPSTRGGMPATDTSGGTWPPPTQPPQLPLGNEIGGLEKHFLQESCDRD